MILSHKYSFLNFVYNQSAITKNGTEGAVDFKIINIIKTIKLQVYNVKSTFYE